MTTTPLSKAATLLVALSIPYACGGSATSDSPQVAPAQTVAESCGLRTTGCPAIPLNGLTATDLTPDSSAITFRVAAAEYGQGTPSGCPSAFVTDIPPAKLNGSQLEIESAWDRDQETNDASGVDACNATKADIVVYGRTSTSEAWRVIDSRTLIGTQSAGSGCQAEAVDHGPGEPGLPNDDVAIWLTPKKYAGGLRVSIVAAAACNPLPVVVKVAEAFE